ncbi:chromosome segregation protein SMC [Thermosipho atlanticus]|uniref:Chromosome partition protein Smc n=1 Tax=Thermosipho atlanticus DSM 15807 TaxID=1123380 RepID=A0A1M5T464_9BACT|nr:chromosome segregation protein SMC [Thermosipho atlanticus]SHH45498.1 condensin subunit Smc [Thermosipho atlanticus DSM 15807]
MSVKLKKIYLKGFKSFAYPTTLPISPDITVIVGPNGSGKSNIVEAIQWAFGEHSLKELRATDKSDVIFKGSDKIRPARSAYVELTFDFDGKEIKIARELTIEGNSTYYINGDVARLKDIKQLFKSTGMFSIVGQGKIERIVTSSPQDIRKLIEDAAGTSVYLDRKKEALGKLAGTEANLERLKDILYEIGKNKRSLYIKAKKAEKYLEYEKELEQLKEKYYGGIFYHESNLLKKLEEERTTKKEHLKEKIQKLAKIESRWSILREEFNEISKEMESFTDLLESHKQRQNQLLELRNTLINKLNELKSNYVEKTSKIDSLKDEKERLGKREEEISLIMDSLKKEIQDKERILASIEEERNLLTSKYSEKEMEFLKKKGEFDELEKKANKLENERNSIYDSQRDFRERLDMIIEQLESKKSRYQELDGEISELSENANKYDEKTKRLLEELENTKNQIRDLTSQREYLKEEFEKILHRKKEIISEISILEKQLNEYQGFSHAVKKVFEIKEQFEGIIDVVANLIETPEKYVEAIEALLGGALQHIVVDTADNAKKILEFAKEKRIGRVTVVPLDLINRNVRSVKLPDEKGVYGFARELVRINKIRESKEKLLEYLFGNDIVVENIDIAIKIKKKSKVGRIATLEGDIVSNQGSMTGGKYENTHSFLARKNLIEKLKEEHKDIEKVEKEIQEKIKGLKAEIDELRDYADTINSELMEYTSKSNSAKRMLQELLKTHSELSKEVENFEKLKREYELRIRGIEERKESLNKEIVEIGEQMKKLKKELENFNKEIFEDREKLDEINEKYADYQTEVRGLYERKIQYESEIKRIHEREKEIDNKISEMMLETKRIKEEMNKFQELIDENEKELQALKAETDELFSSINYKKSGKEGKIKEMENLEKEMESLREETEKIREELHNLELKIQEKKLKIENIPEEYRKEVKLDVDELDELRKKIENFENKIKYIGPVDLGAQEEYERVSKEYDELETQKKDLEEAKKKLVELIERTDEEARQVFLKTFNIVNNAFKKYVEQLFYGGTGIIKIMDKDNLLESGIEIIISKGRGRSQKLQLLSGGEKALVGLALLMALLEAQPSAFYVLDEADAPLDEYNSERFKRLLKSSEAQFIVVTHNKIVMEAADIMLGVTKNNDVSNIVPVRLEEVI